MNTRRFCSAAVALTVAAAACLLCCRCAEAKKPDNTGGGGGDKGPYYQIIKLDMDDGTGRVLDGDAYGISTSRLIVGGVMDAEAPQPRTEAACWTAGNKSAINSAMMAITTSSSMSVKPPRLRVMACMLNSPAGHRTCRSTSRAL